MTELGKMRLMNEVSSWECVMTPDMLPSFFETIVSKKYAIRDLNIYWMTDDTVSVEWKRDTAWEN